VFCTEHGIYPEFNSAWSYYREAPYNEDYFSKGYSDDGEDADMFTAERAREDYLRDHFAHETLQAKQLNSGCYIGRAKQVVEMLRLISFQADFVPDDQWLFVRYAQSNPQIASMDLDRKYFRTAFRQFLDWKHVGVSVDFQMVSLPVDSMNWFMVKQYNEDYVYQSWEHSVSTYYERNLVILAHLRELIVRSVSSSSAPLSQGVPLLHVPTAVHLLHCNNKGSNSLYDSSTRAMYDIYNEYYNHTDGLGSYGEELLRANWLIIDLAFEQAIRVLYLDFGLYVSCTEPANVPVGFEHLHEDATPTLSEKQTVLVCYFRYKLHVALSHHGLTGLYAALTPALEPDMIPSDSYIVQMMYHIVPSFLYLLPR
jgi:hypothetical protein